MTDLKKAKIKALQEFVEKYNTKFWGANIHLNGIMFHSPDKIECHIYGDTTRLLIHYYDLEYYMEISVEDIFSMWSVLPINDTLDGDILRFE